MVLSDLPGFLHLLFLQQLKDHLLLQYLLLAEVHRVRLQVESRQGLAPVDAFGRAHLQEVDVEGRGALLEEGRLGHEVRGLREVILCVGRMRGGVRGAGVEGHLALLVRLPGGAAGVHCLSECHFELLVALWVVRWPLDVEGLLVLLLLGHRDVHLTEGVHGPAALGPAVLPRLPAVGSVGCSSGDISK